MEIEQVIGGVAGDTSAQAIQLRQRIANQNLLSGQVRLRAWDAAGANPVLLISFAANVANAAACSRILVATPNFEFTSAPPVDAAARDFAMVPIPASYLAAGSLTFENTAGTLIYWRVSWGGVGYTGSTAMSNTNGAINTAPPFAGPLPSSGVDALRFTPACATASTNTAAQYAVTPGAATFTNNDNPAGNYVVTAPPGPPVPVFPGSAGLVLIGALGALAVGGGIVRRRLGAN